MFKIGDRVQIKVPHRNTGMFGKRGQIGSIIQINNIYATVEWPSAGLTTVLLDHLTWHKQTKQHNPPLQNGNCYATCIAHILGIHINEVPKFENMFGQSYKWSQILTEWLWEFEASVIELNGHVKLAFPYMVSGPSPNFPGVHHSVVYQNGKMIFDPAHSNKGLLSISHTTFFVNISHIRDLVRKKYNV